MSLLTSRVPHVLVADVGDVVLDADTEHHLRRVLRLREGDRFTCGDGRGSWRQARLGAEVELDGAVVFEPPQRPSLTVCFAVLKGGRNELIVQKLTEIGIDVIVPIETDRVVVRWDADKWRAQRERLVRVAAEATMQSHRAWTPEITEVESFDDACRRSGATVADLGASESEIGETVLIGPEGGWSEAERRRVDALVGLGDTVLRAETASIVAATVMVARRRGVFGA